DRRQRQLVADIGCPDIADVHHAGLGQRQQVLGLAELLRRVIVERDLATSQFSHALHPELGHVLGDVVADRKAVADAQGQFLGLRGVAGSQGGAHHGRGKQCFMQLVFHDVLLLLERLPYGHCIVDGSHRMMAGKAVSSAMTIRCAQTWGSTPRNSSPSGRRVYRATTKTFMPSGGVTMPTSAVTTMMTPNQIG